jgi:hypothetical protein
MIMDTNTMHAFAWAVSRPPGSGGTRTYLPLHPPAADRAALQGVEHQVFDQQADDDAHGEPGEHLVRVQLVA